MRNEKLLEKAIALLPKLYETKVEVARTVNIKGETGDSLEKKDSFSMDVKEAEDFRNLELKKNDKVILDFGNHQVGYLSLDLDFTGSHPDAPLWLKFHFAEQPMELFEDPEAYEGWICSSWIETEQIHVDVIPCELKLPRRYAFRYVSIEVLDISSKYNLKIKNAVCTAVSSADDNKLLSYESKDDRKNLLDRIAVRTLHNCMQTVFEDGPKRDRRLWMGDLRIQALANYETYRKNDLVKACLYLFAAMTSDKGQVGACLFTEPTPEVDDTFMMDYSLFFIASLRDYYVATNDLEAVKDLWEIALKQIEIQKERLNKNYVVKDSDEIGWCFVDWNLNLNKQASAQGIFLYALDAAIELAQVMDDVMAEESLADLYCKMKDASRHFFWDDKRKVFVSGEKKQISYASQVWMVLGGAVDGNTAKKLMEQITEIDDAETMVTPYMMHNYVDALLKVNEKEKALEVLMEYWGGMADMGADTFFELYNPKNPKESPYGGTIVNSYCHAWSCAPAYFLRKYFRD